jgi:low temperature requirement protein LtrA
VLEVTIGLGQVEVDGLTLAVALVGIVVGFGAWWTYFDFVGHRPPRQDRTSTLVWILAHLPLTAALAVMGAAVASLATQAHVVRTATATAWGLALSAAIVLAVTGVLTTSLEAPRPVRRGASPWAATVRRVRNPVCRGLSLRDDPDGVSER